ncbi:hypothetical protein J6590_077493, partial [Homalodisca vitripennis]
AILDTHVGKPELNILNKIGPIQLPWRTPRCLPDGNDESLPFWLPAVSHRGIKVEPDKPNYEVRFGIKPGSGDSDVVQSVRPVSHYTV